MGGVWLRRLTFPVPCPTEQCRLWQSLDALIECMTKWAPYHWRFFRHFKCACPFPFNHASHQSDSWETLIQLCTNALCGMEVQYKRWTRETFDSFVVRHHDKTAYRTAGIFTKAAELMLWASRQWTCLGCMYTNTLPEVSFSIYTIPVWPAAQHQWRGSWNYSRWHYR